MTNLQLAVHFFFQIGAILIVCQIVGLVGRRAGQPQVVSEMLAGVLLGPSLLGLFLPAVSAKLFPPETLRVLFPVSQLGLAAYMFVVGLEFRMDIVQRQMRSAVAVSIAGMAAPFVLGAALGWYFHGHTSLFPAKTSLVEAMIFLGASMCITAFPMLARILHFKRLTGTTMGTVAIGAGAFEAALSSAKTAVALDPSYMKGFLRLGCGQHTRTHSPASQPSPVPHSPHAGAPHNVVQSRLRSA